MDYHLITLWFVSFSCLAGLIAMLRRIRSGVTGWIILYLGILLLNGVGWVWEQNWLIYAAALVWLLFALLPGLLALRYHRLFMEQRYAAARRLTSIISWLHPADGWREQPEIMLALELAQRGEMTKALEIFKRHEDMDSPTALAAMVNFYRLTGRWSEFLEWQTQHGAQFKMFPQFLHVLLRARGETGDLTGLIELYESNETKIAKLDPPVQRDLCRLMLFVFCGRRESVERLLRGPLRILPPATREFWLATADLAADKRESAKHQFEALLPKADPTLRLAIERRLAQISSPDPTPASHEPGILLRVETEHGQDERFGAQPTLFSRMAGGTQTLMLLNTLMFVAEVRLGGSTDADVLYRLGAMFTPAVQSGEWWRLIAAIFLHFGPLHLLMNMLALWVLGPFVEFAFGRWRFLCIYLLSGIGSMALVMALAIASRGEQLTVGASGCVMGLVGATGALMLRGWLKEKAQSARKRLIYMVAILVMQTLFDALVPQVSMTAHLSGAGIGFALGMILSHRLKSGQPSDQAE